MLCQITPWWAKLGCHGSDDGWLLLLERYPHTAGRIGEIKTQCSITMALGSARRPSSSSYWCYEAIEYLGTRTSDVKLLPSSTTSHTILQLYLQAAATNIMSLLRSTLIHPIMHTFNCPEDKSTVRVHVYMYLVYQAILLALFASIRPRIDCYPESG